MDFIIGLPTMRKGNDSIWVIVDQLTKSAHFLLVKNLYRPPEYADLYMADIEVHSSPLTFVNECTRVWGLVW